MVVVTDSETVTGGLAGGRVELGCNLADISLGLPAGRVNVRLDDRLDAELGRQRTDRILVFTQQVDVRCRRGQAVSGQSVAQFVRELEERERLDLGEPERREFSQRGIEILRQGIAHGVQLDRQLRH